MENEYLRDFETGKPADVTIDEDTGRLLQALHGALSFMYKGPDIIVDDLRMAKMVHDLNIPGILQQLEVVMANNMTTLVPYAQLVEETFQKQATPTLTLIHACAMAHIPYEVRADKMPSSEEVAELSRALGWRVYYMQKVLNLFNWSWDDIKLASRGEIVKATSSDLH